SIDCVIGVPYFDSQSQELYNAALFIKGKEITKIIKKASLRRSGEILETAYFTPGSGAEVISSQGRRFILSVGDDFKTLEDDADFIISLNSNPFSYLEHAERVEALRHYSRETGTAVFNVNQVGAQGSLIFDGRSVIVDESRSFLDELNAFAEDLRLYQIKDKEIKPLQLKQTEA